MAQTNFCGATLTLSVKLCKFQCRQAPPKPLGESRNKQLSIRNGEYHGKYKKPLIIPGNAKTADIRGQEVRDVKSKYANDSAGLRHNLLDRIYSARVLAEDA